ncbi:BfmA/BtgA family mobilization protein [Dyadobacter sp. CY347]|jgi:hypothetical protein|uniref:BfmA/BtgA family mobilization protein n=1 Tax=Dyadobacter sp. CY347 TaxID=2909336 RepID=UPI001F3B5D52|nr:BfmA/BtgA family mobilization protein [Dyadobacter sp. CY347]MCF2491697.1 hypothetical protein [Dyadobacter sp. CY347]
MEKKYNKSVRFTETTDEKFGKIAEKLGRSKQDLLAEMVDYFYKSKKDPSDLSDELLKKELGQGINRIISFVKVQEKDILAPMLAEQKLQHEQFRKYARLLRFYFGENEDQQVAGHFMEMVRLLHKGSKASQTAQEKTGGLVERLLAEVNNFQGTISDLRKEKDRIRNHFVLLFENYIREREDLNSVLNSFGSSAAVKKLQDETRSQFKSI